MIELKKLNFNYGDKVALKNVDLKIKKGEAVALIGPNGSGKSTLLKVLNGIAFPQEGEYTFRDVSITENALNKKEFSKKFHKTMGFIFQNSSAQLFSPTVYEEVAFGPMQMQLPQDELERRVDDCINILNIKDLKNQPTYKLSYGEKKRVAIASILSMNPEVLTMDEPMNGIDPKGKRFLKDLFIKLNKAGKTILCATHEFYYMRDVFTRAVVFSEDHRIIRDDSFESVIDDIEFLRKNNII